MRSKWIILATIGLLAGAVGPHPCSAQPPNSARQWIDAVNQVDGKTYRIAGWLDPAGQPHFNPSEYPQFVSRPGPGPAQPDVNPALPAQPGPKPNWPFPQAGVTLSKIPRPVAGQSWYGGNAVKVIEAGMAAPKAKPPDVHLTVIGVEAEQVKARERLQGDPRFRALEASMGDRLAVQFYGPTDPMVARVGLVDGGRPDVVIQTADGKEQKRYHSDPGPESLIAEIRKCDPTYRPGRDDQGGGINISGATIFGGIVVVGLAVLIYQNRGRR